MADPVPLANQHGTGSRFGLVCRDAWSPRVAVLAGALKQAASGGFDATKRLLLQPIRNRVQQQPASDADGRLGAVERTPALLERVEFEPAERGEFGRQAF